MTTAQLDSAAAAAAGVCMGAGLGIKLFSIALLHLEHRQVLLKVQMEKKASRKSTTQPNAKTNSENLQYQPRKTWSESDTNDLPKKMVVEQERQKGI